MGFDIDSDIILEHEIEQEIEVLLQLQNEEDVQILAEEEDNEVLLQFQNEEDEEILDDGNVLLEVDEESEDEADPALLEQIAKRNEEFGLIPRIIPELFINNILASETVVLADKKICLKFEEVIFLYAIIKGIIVNVTVKDRKTTIFVDDNTEIIPCIIDFNVELESCRNFLETEGAEEEEEDEESDESDSEEGMLETCAIMKDELIEIVQNCPDYLSVAEGDIVKIMGKFKDFRNLRMCFVTDIIKVSTDIEDSIFHLEGVKNFHDEHENIKKVRIELEACEDINYDELVY